MANNRNNRSVYGVGQPKVEVSGAPIIANRYPTKNDKFPIGTSWIQKTCDVNACEYATYILAGIKDNKAAWIRTNGGNNEFDDLLVSESFHADMSNTATSSFVVETGLGDDNAINLNSVVNGGGINLDSGGNLSVGSASSNNAGAAITLNSKVGTVRLTGNTTAAGATQTYVIANTEASWGSPIILTVANGSDGNNSKITLEGVYVRNNIITVYTKNNGADALDGDLTISWILLSI